MNYSDYFSAKTALVSRRKYLVIEIEKADKAIDALEAIYKESKEKESA